MKSYVWDLATRLFHWTLVIFVSISMYTGFVGGFKEMDWHMYSGYAVLVLIIFRVAWGIVGSHNARFTTFIKGPRAIFANIRQLWSGPPGVGHSPLGALSVVAILLALFVQATSGLFTSDDIFIEGPLIHLVSDDMSKRLSGIHDTNRWIIVGLIGLHITAITAYELVRNDRLVLPMITGWKKAIDRPPEQNRLIVALIVLGAAGGGVYCLVELA